MSLSLNDYEDVAQEEEQSKKAEEQAVVAAAPAPAASSGIQPPAQNNGLNVPGLINQSWQGIKPYLNPLHYNDNGPQDYTNVDIPTSVVHGLGEGAVGLGLANRLKRAVSGENAQYAEQNKLNREKFEYEKAQNALNQQQVEQKVTAQAVGNPLAEPNGRIESTLNQAPVAPPVEAQAPVQAPAVPTAEEIRYQAFQEDQRRKNELHEKKLAAIEAKNAEGKSQKTTASGGISPEDRQMLQSSEKAKMDKAISAEQKAVTPKITATPNVQPATPIASQQTPTSVVEAQAAGPSIKTPQEIFKSATAEPTVIPEGMHPQYKRNAANPIGPSAFNHLVNNKGLEEATKIWEDVYGKTNVPYDEFMQKYSKEAGKNMHGPRTPLPEGTKPGGTFGKSEFIPEYIRGSTPTGNLKATGTAAVGAALAYPAIKEAMHLVKKGEYTKAANTLVPFSAVIPPLGALMAPLYTSSEEQKTLDEMKLKGFKNFKQFEEYKNAVGGGRGISSASSYKKP